MLPNKMPLVSIIIPVYNGCNYLKEAIDSALEQTYSNIEVIVVNDGSTDGTDAIALSYGNKIRYFKKENGGVSSALNCGIKNMRGEYFSWLSHDDKYSPYKIESQINCLTKLDNKKVVAYCDSVQINQTGSVIRKSKKNKFLSIGINNEKKSLKALIKSGCLNGCALLIPRQAFYDAGVFNENLKFAQDLLMWINIFLCGYCVYYGRGDYVFSRIHENQGTQKDNAVFRQDSSIVSGMIIDDMKKATSREYRYTYYLAFYFAKYHCIDAAKLYKKNGGLKLFEKIRVDLVLFYGLIRPKIRRVYYRVFRKMKTN